MTNTIGAAAAALAMLAASPSLADVIVDTGVGSNTVEWGFSTQQWLAAEFTTGDATLTDLLGYINGYTGSTYHVALYADGGETPGSELYSTQVAYTGVEGLQGATGVNWAVSAGSYFLAFEVRAGDTLAGGMKNIAASPLASHAFTTGGIYFEYDTLNLGVRVEGDTVAVPEPATWALMIGGFGLAGSALRRRKSAVAA